MASYVFLPIWKSNQLQPLRLNLRQYLQVKMELDRWPRFRMVRTLSRLDTTHFLGKFYISQISCMECISLDTIRWLHRSLATNIVQPVVLLACHDHNVRIVRGLLLRRVPCSQGMAPIAIFYFFCEVVRLLGPYTRWLVTLLYIVVGLIFLLYGCLQIRR